MFRFKNVLYGTCDTLVTVLHKNNIEMCVAQNVCNFVATFSSQRELTYKECCKIEDSNPITNTLIFLNQSKDLYFSVMRCFTSQLKVITNNK